MLNKSLTISPVAGIYGLHSVTADLVHVGHVAPLNAGMTKWCAINADGDQTESFPTKIDAAAYISNNGED